MASLKRWGAFGSQDYPRNCGGSGGSGLMPGLDFLGGGLTQPFSIRKFSNCLPVITEFSIFLPLAVIALSRATKSSLGLRGLDAATVST